MVNLSKNKVDKYVLYKLNDLLFIVFFENRKEDKFKKLITALFSNIERLMILKRLGAFYLVIKGFNNYKICSLLKISQTTLNKFKLILEKDETTLMLFKKFIKKEEFANIFEEVMNTIYGPGTPGVDWSEVLRTKRKIKKRKLIGL